MKTNWSEPLRVGSKFENPSGAKPKGPLDLIKWIARETRSQWPSWSENSHQASVKLNLNREDMNCVMINHASLLLQLPQGNLLTDPVFSNRTSPFRWAGPSRRREPGLKLEELPRVDVVLLSHNHYDHMDLVSLKFLWKKFDPIFLMPLQNANFLKEAGILSRKFEELTWWQETNALGLKIVLTPAQHWSSRGPFDRNKALWGGFWIENNYQRIFFAGDTGYAEHFAQIRSRLGPASLSLLPIGAYEPRWFMRDQHMNPEDAVLAHLDLQSKVSLGIHWGTWQLTNEAMEDPELELSLAKDKHGLADSQFWALLNGETYFVSSVQN